MKKELILPPGTDVDKMTIAPGVKVGNFLWVSGSAGAKDGKLPGEWDIVAQSRQAMENLGRVLQAAGTSWENVIKVNCFLVDAARDFAGWNKVFKEYFPTNPPARTTVGGDIAMNGALVEVEMVVLVP